MNSVSTMVKKIKKWLMIKDHKVTGKMMQVNDKMQELKSFTCLKDIVNN